MCTAAGEKEVKVKESGPSKREDQLDHLNMEMPPSPQPTSTTTDRPQGYSRENSMQASMSTVNLPPDTQKFLKFAGKFIVVKYMSRAL